MSTYLKVLGESFPMNSNMAGFRWVSNIFAFLCFEQKQPQHWKGSVFLVYLLMFLQVMWREAVAMTTSVSAEGC